MCVSIPLSQHFPSCSVTMCHMEVTWKTMYTNLKKKIVTKRWLKKEMRWNTYCSVNRVLFHYYERGKLNSKGKPHGRWKLFKSILLPSHTHDWNRIAVGSLGNAAICGHSSLCCRGCLGETLPSYGLVSSVTKVNQDSVLGEHSKWPHFNTAFSLDIPY